MPEEPLDYAGMLSKLVGLFGQVVEVAVRGIDGQPPLVVYWSGELKRGGEVYGGALVGYDPEAFALVVGDVALTIHPDHFRRASWDDGRGRNLGVQLGNLVLQFRAASATRPQTSP